MFDTHLAELRGDIERWRNLILLGQSDFLKFLNNKEARSMYGKAAVSDEQIDSQRSYVVGRYKELAQDLKIANLYLVLEPSAKIAHLLVPVAGPQGEYFTALEWINGDWYLVPGTGDISWPVLNAKKVIQAVESQKLEFGQAKDIGRVMRKLSAAYLLPTFFNPSTASAMQASLPNHRRKLSNQSLATGSFLCLGSRMQGHRHG